MSSLDKGNKETMNQCQKLLEEIGKLQSYHFYRTLPLSVIQNSQLILQKFVQRTYLTVKPLTVEQLSSYEDLHCVIRRLVSYYKIPLANPQQAVLKINSYMVESYVWQVFICLLLRNTQGFYPVHHLLLLLHHSNEHHKFHRAVFYYFLKGTILEDKLPKLRGKTEQQKSLELDLFLLSDFLTYSNEIMHYNIS